MKIKEEIIKAYDKDCKNFDENEIDGVPGYGSPSWKFHRNLLSQAIDKAYEAGGEDMLNKLRKEGSTKLKMKLLGLNQ